MKQDRPCVLVHGGWCGGWHWDPVTDRLRARGLAVEAPTLTGMAERAHEARPDTGLHRHIEDVTALIETRGIDDVVLVGHSYGGAVVTGVAHGRAARRIAELVYLDAFVPRIGQSLADLMGAEFIEAATQAARRAGTPYLVPPMFSVEAAVGWTGQRAAAHAARLCAQPLATATDALRASGRCHAERTYIACTAQPLGLFDAYAEQARNAPDWRYFELPSPHDAVHNMPAAVAGIIETLAARPDA